MNLAQALCNHILLKHSCHPFYVLFFILVSSSFSLTHSKKDKKSWLGCVRIQQRPPSAAGMMPVSSLAHLQHAERDRAMVARGSAAQRSHAPSQKGPYGGVQHMGAAAWPLVPEAPALAHAKWWWSPCILGVCATSRSIMGQETSYSTSICNKEIFFFPIKMWSVCTKIFWPLHLCDPQACSFPLKLSAGEVLSVLSL